ncbi:restriction endonuclease subunit S [Gordonia sp. NPDC062954]|uniref:restriction endonuclease subunit S n=1 Tax=Gordonia sp. NPDC062954 TaxID=3364003 RepID=UPI0037C57081
MAEWKLRRLEDVVELRRGFDLPSQDRNGGPIPVLSAGVTAGWHSESRVKGPGFVVGRATNLGQPTWSDDDYWPLNTTLYAADFKGNSPRFLYHLFEVTDLSGFDSGSVQPMLNRNYIAHVPVLIPPRSTQRAIADVLGALDDKIAANRLVADTAMRLASASFARSSETAISKTLSLGELVAKGLIEFGDGYRTKKSELAMSGFRIIRAADVKDALVRSSGSDFVSDTFASQIGKKAACPGDIVVTTKGTVGRVAIVAEAVGRAVYSPQCCYLRVPEGSALNYGYVVGWSLSADIQRQLALLMHKTDMAPYVNLKDIGSLAIPVPHEDAQRRIGAEQRALVELQHTCSAENEVLTRTRDQLLPLLMSGKVTVKDAEDEVGGLV